MSMAVLEIVEKVRATCGGGMPFLGSTVTSKRHSTQWTTDSCWQSWSVVGREEALGLGLLESKDVNPLFSSSDIGVKVSFWKNYSEDKIAE